MFLMYKPKGDRVRAEQVTAENVADLAKLFNGRLIKEGYAADDYTREPGQHADYKIAGFEYPTFEGIKKINLGEWVIQNDDGTYRKMSDKEFTERYEQARVVTRTSS